MQGVRNLHVNISMACSGPREPFETKKSVATRMVQVRTAFRRGYFLEYRGTLSRASGLFVFETPTGELFVGNFPLEVDAQDGPMAVSNQI